VPGHQKRIKTTSKITPGSSGTLPLDPEVIFIRISSNAHQIFIQYSSNIHPIWDQSGAQAPKTNQKDIKNNPRIKWHAAT
jgi:hypothetical protein